MRIFIAKLLTCMLGLILLSANLGAAAAPVTESKPISYVLALADIHFDPFLACADATSCPFMQKLQHSSANLWPKLFAIYDVSQPQMRQDSNFVLLTSSLAAARKVAAEHHPQFVLILGDFLAHDMRAKYKKFTNDNSLAGFQSFVYKTLEFLNIEINQYFPKLDVYAVVGNNDTYAGDYVSSPNSQFFQDTAKIWSHLIKNPTNRAAMQKSFIRAGYYAVTIPSQPRLRLIALNSNVFSYKAKGRNVTLAANDELNWLHKELEASKAHQQQVFIAMHIPMSLDIYASERIRLFTLMQLWAPRYTATFNTQIQQYAPSISAIFAGHLHSDWFQNLTFNRINDIPTSGAPSISPIIGNNPAFKLYAYSPHTFKLIDTITYFIPLSNR